MTSKPHAATLPAGLPADQRPYGVSWLDSCYQETLLPNGPWNDTVNSKLCASLAEKVSRQFDHEDRKQMMFELLGQDFVKRYFPSEECKPESLMPPYMSHIERTKLHHDALNWLRNTINEVAADVKCQRPQVAEEKGATQCEEMKEFLSHTKNVFIKGLDRHLHLQERDLIKAWQSAAAQKERAQTEAPSKRGPSRPPSSWTIAPPQDPAHIAARVCGTSDTAPVFWGMQSNTLGKAVLALLQREPRRFSEVAARLHGKQLPASLRTYMWMDVLLKKERERANRGNVEQAVRERFAKCVSRGVTEMRLKQATRSPISGLINNAVIEMYESTPGMGIFSSQTSHLKDAAHSLNVLYTYDRTYEPYLIHWLFPLQLAFKRFSKEREHSYDLAMMLDLLNSNCFPSWPQIFSIAQNVMTRLRIKDPEFHDHLMQICAVEPRVNPKEFLVQLIDAERKGGEPASHPAQPGILNQPVIFLRKWIGEGFVGVLDSQAAVYVWDQLFMQLWDSVPIEDVCLSLLLLLRYKFMAARNYTQMKRVFLLEPCKLYTMDLQRAWCHLQGGQDMTDIPAMNRHSRPSTEPPTDRAGDDSLPPDDPVVLPPVAIKNIRLHLQLSDHALTSVPWLTNFDTSLLHLQCSVYFGSILLHTRQSSVTPKQSTSTADTFHVDFPGQTFTFSDMDLSQYDVEREIGHGRPYAIIGVELESLSGKMRKRLGWGRVPLYYENGVLETGDKKVSVQDSMGEGSTLSLTASAKGLLVTPPSALDCHVYDPTKKTDPLPKSPQQKAATQPSDNAPSVGEEFDVYIDGVVNIPDNASVVKVTGKLIKAGDVPPTDNILALPSLESPARNPRFNFRQTFKATRADCCLLLRVYTVDMDTRKLVVIGSRFTEVYNTRTNKLLMGSHRAALHHGMPNSTDIEKITSQSHDDLPRIPACSVLYRLLPDNSEEYIAASTPDPTSKDDLDLTTSEQRIVNSFSKDLSFPQRVKDIAVRLQNVDTAKGKKDDLAIWIRNRLDPKIQLPEKTPAPDIDLSHIVGYRDNVGLKVHIHQAYGIQEGSVVQCVARVLPGKMAAQMTSRYAGHGGLVKTHQHDLDSLQRSPIWSDDPMVFYPALDSHSCLLVTVFSLTAPVYVPHPSHSQAGRLTTNLSPTVLGWTVMPLFDSLYVSQAENHVPLFRGAPPQDLVSALQDKDVYDVMRARKWNKDNIHDATSMVVRVWDAHYDFTQIPSGLKRNDLLLEATNKKAACQKAEKDKQGKNMSQFILSSLDKKDQKLGTTNNPIYVTEVGHFREAVDDKFAEIMDEHMEK